MVQILAASQKNILRRPLFPGLMIIGILFEETLTSTLLSTSLASKSLRSQQSVKSKSRVDIAAQLLRPFSEKKNMPGLMTVGFTV